LIGRSFYVLYVKNIRSRSTVVVAWVSLVFMVSFWTVYLAMGGWGAAEPATGAELGTSEEPLTPAPTWTDVTLHVPDMIGRQGIT
jgi:hypothetical protein